jgi:hypothetical protein
MSAAIPPEPTRNSSRRDFDPTRGRTGHIACAILPGSTTGFDATDTGGIAALDRRLCASTPAGVETGRASVKNGLSGADFDALRMLANM